MGRNLDIDPRHEEPPRPDGQFDPPESGGSFYFSWSVIKIALTIAGISVIIWMCIYAALGRDDGRYADSPLKPWFNSLKDKTGNGCCADADGAVVKDVDWSAQGEGQHCQHTPAISFSKYDVSYEWHYCVRYKETWWLVPDRAVIEEPNRFGQAVIWPICKSPAHVSGADTCKDDDSSLLFIRCFIIGAGA